MIDLPDRYRLRMVGEGSTIRVYGDTSKAVLLGRVNSQTEAMKLLDSYDSQIERRQYIANHILKGNEENENAKEVSEKLKYKDA